MVVILVLVVIAGYLVWLRSKYQPQITPQVVKEVEVTPTVLPSPASPSATEGDKEATKSMKEKTSTGSSMKK